MMKRWHEIDLDPNSAEVLVARRGAIVASRSGKFVDNRNKYLCDLAKGKDVLDIGVVEHTREAINEFVLVDDKHE